MDISDRWYALNNPAEALQKRFEQRRDQANLMKSMSSYKTAAAYSVSSLSDRLSASKKWIALARKYDTWSLAYAYSTALYLLNRSVLQASNIRDRHVRLISTGVSGKEIAVEAASHAIGTCRLRSAIEMLEQWRGLMFYQLGNYRTPSDDLEAVNKVLSDRLRELNVAME
ncbi:hypothetical protein FRB96_004805 [Tulasnella sp. 330]|nr:hypothetical protein FRB96_004805 [Tulasnella sp. 330]KAG8883325.1 hypothetical protein FRB98_003171 [Tulasnella sp. 332]